MKTTFTKIVPAALALAMLSGMIACGVARADDDKDKPEPSREERAERERREAVESQRDAQRRAIDRAEMRKKADELHTRMREAMQTGRRDLAEQLGRELHAIAELLEGPREGDRPGPPRGDRERGDRERGDREREGRPEARALMQRIRHAHAAREQLQAAGMGDMAERIGPAIERMERDLARMRERDGDRHEEHADHDHDHDRDREHAEGREHPEAHEHGDRPPAPPREMAEAMRRMHAEMERMQQEVRRLHAELERMRGGDRDRQTPPRDGDPPRIRRPDPPREGAGPPRDRD